MKTVSIYLRAIDQNRLSLFDSNRNGAINDLTTEVRRGSVIVWKLDCNSGIKEITKIASKSGKKNVFINDPVKRRFFKGFTLQIPLEANGEEAYTIDYILCNGEKITIDPYIRIIPPM
jgi:hypothetical protein